MSVTPVKVDVMLPAYGGSQLLREAIDSVLGQDLDCWRLTVIDDAVTEDPELGTFLAAAAERFGPDRVRYWRNPTNLGINRNFQRCLDSAEAALVVVLGGDDRMLPDYVRTVTTVAEEHPEVAFIHPGVRIIDGEGKPVLPLVDRMKQRMRPAGDCTIGGESLASSLLQGNWMYFPSIAFRREVVQKYRFRDGYAVVLDLDLYLQMLFDGHEVRMVSHPCFEYRRHANSLSSTEAVSGDRFDEEQGYFSVIREEVRQLGWRKASRAASQHLTSRLHAVALTPKALRAGDLRMAARLVRHVFGGTSEPSRA